MVAAQAQLTSIILSRSPTIIKVKSYEGEPRQKKHNSIAMKSTNNKIKVLFISRELISGDLSYILKKEGCNVRLHIVDRGQRSCLDGIVEKTESWKKDINWVGKNGLIIFDDVGFGKIQDKLRKDGYLVIGGSGDGDRLEQDRLYGQSILEKSGVKTNKLFSTKEFSILSAISHIKKNPGKWVIKQNHHNTAVTYVGLLEDGSDVLSVLDDLKTKVGSKSTISLQRKVDGVEVAIGRFFNGHDWCGPSVINFEHKHLCNDDIGPMGGESGTLMWYEEDDTNKLFQRALAGLKDHLIRSNYKGYIDVNCIVFEEDLYPLEVTSRFGSSTIETQCEIHTSPWKDFFYAIAKGEKPDLQYKKGYTINVALTVPPFPYRTTDKKMQLSGMRIFFANNVADEEMKHIHFEGVAMKKVKGKEVYSTSGNLGYALYVTSTAKSVEEARESVYSLIKNITIPRMFYRTDIGMRFLRRDKQLLQQWGWI